MKGKLMPWEGIAIALFLWISFWIVLNKKRPEK